MGGSPGRQKLFLLAKGFRGRAKNCYRVVKQAVYKSLSKSFVGRKEHKREIKTLWIQVMTRTGRANTDTRDQLHIINRLDTRAFPVLVSLQKINAGSRQHGMKYNELMNGLKQDNVQLDRKILAELAEYEPHTFQTLVERVKFMKGVPPPQ